VKITRDWRALVVLVVLFGVVAPLGFAQRRMGGGKGMPRYNPSTEVTVKGTVEKVTENTSPLGWPGTHLTVKAGAETLDVHVGPSDFLTAKKFEIAAGDQVEVVGSKIKYEGADALLAREIKKGDKSLILRNAQGIPQWSAGRRRETLK
jgi:hypothetical protein